MPWWPRCERCGQYPCQVANRDTLKAWRFCSFECRELALLPAEDAVAAAEEQLLNVRIQLNVAGVELGRRKRRLSELRQPVIVSGPSQ